VSHLTAGYEDTTILRDVSLEVPEHGTLAVLGPNGAGKTTLLKAIAGLLEPTSGSITVGGVDVTGMSPSARVKQGLCLIPDPRGIFPSLTVKENLRLQARRGGSGDAVTDLAINAFPRLGQRMRQRAGTLSGGEQQMLAIARAYIQSPELILLDEVSMGLAPNLVDEIFEFLETLSKQGAALVLVEQFVHRALAIADSVAVLAKGRLVLTGDAGNISTEDVFNAYTGLEPAGSITT
jgi:branched-chain amino acid transport system ATP-binding protein